MASSFSKSWTGSLRGGLMGKVEKELSRIGQTRGERLITKVIDQKGINFRGDLKGSVTTDTERTGRTVTMKVGPDAEHAVYVLKGTRPHWAPIAPLREWARLKLGDERIGYAVQHKIARVGTDPKDFLTGPARLIEAEAPKRLEKVVEEHLEG